MTMNRVLFSSQSVDWPTPAHLFLQLNREFKFNLDPCPLDAVTVDNGPLLSNWTGKRVYCNPPYGQPITDWLARWTEAELAVYLLPARTDTRWFHLCVLPEAKEIRFIRGRLRFGAAKHSAPFPSMLVIFHHKETS